MIQAGNVDSDINPVSGTDWKSVTLDEPTNLDFRNGETGWELSAENGTGADYGIGVDPHGVLDGPAAYLTAKISQPSGDGVIHQKCRADIYRGKRICCSAWVRTEDVKVGAGFYLHLDAPDRVRTWNMLDNPIMGTTEWKRYEHVVDVAPINQGFIFGADLEGSGKVWVRDIRFEAVDESVPLSPISNDFAIENGRIRRADCDGECA